MQAVQDYTLQMKRAVGLLPPLAEPKSSRALADIPRPAGWPSWLCLVVVAGQEEAIQERLRRFGLESYYPQGRALKRKRSTRGGGGWLNIHTVRPAFAGYLFVDLAPTVNLETLRTTEGVLSFVATEDDNGGFIPLRMRDRDIDELRERVRRGEFDWDYQAPLAPKFDIVQNDHVIMKDGALAKYTGVVRRTPKSRSVEVVPDLFPNRVVLIDIGKLEVIP